MIPVWDDEFCSFNNIFNLKMDNKTIQALPKDGALNYKKLLN